MLLKEFEWQMIEKEIGDIEPIRGPPQKKPPKILLLEMLFLHFWKLNLLWLEVNMIRLNIIK